MANQTQFRSLSVVGYTNDALSSQALSRLISDGIRTVGAWPNVIDAEPFQGKRRRRKLKEGSFEFEQWLELSQPLKRVDAFRSVESNFDDIAPSYSVHCFSDDLGFEVGYFVIAPNTHFGLEQARKLCVLALETYPADIGGSLINRDIRAAQFAYTVMNYEGSSPESNTRASYLVEVMMNRGVRSTQPFLAVSDLNVISSVHLDMRIGGRSFVEWVKQKGFGFIEEVTTKNSMWIIPDLGTARTAHKILYDEGIVALSEVLFCGG
jgi:hypothetical protein